jgi:hypothetical protein
MAGILKVDKYQDFNGNDIMTSDGSGNVTLSSNMNTAVKASGTSSPAFHAYNPQNGSVASGTTIIVSNNTTLLNSGSAYNTSTYKFTPQEAGYYFLYANIRYQSGDAQFDRINLVITKNGSDILAARNGHQDYTTCNVSGMVYANGSSDYFQMTSYHGKGSAVNITTEDEFTYFGGYRIIGA